MRLTRKQRFMLVVVLVGAFVTVLNQTLIGTCLPTIMETMHVDAPTAQWLTTGFTLVNAIMIPIAAFLQDRFPTRSLFLFSMIVFAIGSLGAAWGFNFGILLAGRLIQGLAAGILMPMAMTVLLVTYPIEKRGAAMGLFGLVIAFAPAIGPTVSGIMVDVADWHLMFYVIAGLSATLAILGLFLIEKGDPAAKRTDSKLDPLSVLLSTAGFGGLLYGFSVFGTEGIDWLCGSAMVGGLACVVWFFIRQERLAVPLLRVTVLKNRKFLIATIIGMLVQASLLAAPILMPIYVQDLMGYSATVSGLVLMPGAIVMAIMNPVAGKIFDKHGARALSIIGMALLVVTTVGFGFLSLDSSLIYIAILYLTRMISMALVNMPITTWGMNALETQFMNHGTSVNNTLKQVAGSLGTAIVISVSAMVQTWQTPAVGDLQARMYGVNIAFLVCAAIVVVGLVLTIVFVKGKPGQEYAEEEAATGEEAAALGQAIASGDALHNKEVLSFIMKRDVFTLHPDDTVQQAMQLFISKNISACPIVDDEGAPIGFISDGDILKRLSRQSGSYTDPIALIAASAMDSQGYNEKLNEVMQLPVSSVGVKSSIGVNLHADLVDVCRVLAQNHLKKVPVLDKGKIVGIVNRSDITKYSMEAYLAGRPDEALMCTVDGEQKAQAVKE